MRAEWWLAEAVLLARALRRWLACALQPLPCFAWLSQVDSALTVEYGVRRPHEWIEAEAQQNSEFLRIRRPCGACSADWPDLLRFGRGHC